MLVQDLLLEANKKQAEAVEKKDPELMQEAHDTFMRLANQLPDDPHIQFSLGTSFLYQGYNGIAINLLSRALCFQPNNPAIHCNIGAAYKAEDRHIDAERHLIIANTLHRNAEYLNNLAALWVNRGYPERGIPFGEEALAMSPTLAKAAWNLALLELEAGKWEAGFRHYTAGIDTGDRFIKILRDAQGDILPMWDGTPGKRVVVYGEQGIGDEIMFASAIPELAADCSELVINAHPRLEHVFRRSFGNIKNITAIYGDRKQKEIEWDIGHDFDAMVPMGNLFMHYRTAGNFPRSIYLKPNPERTAHYRELLMKLGPPPYVGFSWEGGSKLTHTKFRSAKLGHFRDMFDLPATFVSLQYTKVHDKIDRFNADGILIHELSEAVDAFDYDETIALVAALDLVVSVCTSVVHVCGAIGKDCIVMTPFQRAWRYSEDPTMFQYGDWVRQFHKGEHESWEEYAPRLIESVGRKLS